MTVPECEADTLIDIGPQGMFTAYGWEGATPAIRAKTVLRESVTVIEGAAHALYAQCSFNEAGRTSALMFVAGALMAQARLMKRATEVLIRLEDEAPARSSRAKVKQVEVGS